MFVVSVPPTVNPANIGAAVVAIFWIVLTAPPLTTKFAPLNDAIPLELVEASLIVIVEPAPVALLSVSAPVKPLSESTTEPAPTAAQVTQLMLPFASIASGPLALTATVPLAFGSVIVLFAPSGVAKTSEFVIPLAVALKLVLALPCRLKLCPADPTIIAPVGVIVFAFKIPATARLPVKLAAFEIV